MKFIHYRHKSFDINQFEEIHNVEYRNKPHGGLWASPIDTKYGWKQWCEREEFRECNEDNSFSFELTPEANIYHINCKDDIVKLPLVDSKFKTSWVNPDFEKIVASGIDAIQFNLSNDTSEDYIDSMYYLLYGWDCDCILILNKDIIKTE